VAAKIKSIPGFQGFNPEKMDVLVLENQVLYKEEQPASGVSDVDPYKGEYRVVGEH